LGRYGELLREGLAGVGVCSRTFPSFVYARERERECVCVCVCACVRACFYGWSRRERLHLHIQYAKERYRMGLKKRE
jgi:hypothetical protein